MGSTTSEIMDLYLGRDEDEGFEKYRSRSTNYNPRYAKQRRSGHTPLGINGRGRGRSVSGCSKRGKVKG